jgi:hypothetical protein
MKRRATTSSRSLSNPFPWDEHPKGWSLKRQTDWFYENRPASMVEAFGHLNSHEQWLHLNRGYGLVDHIDPKDDSSRPGVLSPSDFAQWSDRRNSYLLEKTGNSLLLGVPETYSDGYLAPEDRELLWDIARATWAADFRAHVVDAVTKLLEDPSRANVSSILEYGLDPGVDGAAFFEQLARMGVMDELSAKLSYKQAEALHEDNRLRGAAGARADLRERYGQRTVTKDHTLTGLAKGNWLAETAVSGLDLVTAGSVSRISENRRAYNEGETTRSEYYETQRAAVARGVVAVGAMSLGGSLSGSFFSTTLKVGALGAGMEVAGQAADDVARLEFSGAGTYARAAGQGLAGGAGAGLVLKGLGNVLAPALQRWRTRGGGVGVPRAQSRLPAGHVDETAGGEFLDDAIRNREQSLSPTAEINDLRSATQADTTSSNGMSTVTTVAAEAGAVSADATTVLYFRVQGGTPPNASRVRIHVDDAGDVTFSAGTLNISRGDMAHAAYFQSLRPGSSITSFRVPKWFDDFLVGMSVRQKGYRSNPANQGGNAPKVVDPRQPGMSLELPPIWAGWLNEIVVKGSGSVR